MLAVAVYSAMARSHNTHRSVSYVALQYLLVLPALLFFLRRSRVRPAAPFSVPDFRSRVIAGFAVLAAIVGFSYDHGHTIPDESAYLFQARLFASGHLKAAPMPGATASVRTTPPEIYFEHHIHTLRGWFAKYPPGWPFALSIGYLLGCPWLVNPVLGVLLLLLVNHVASHWGPSTSNLAVLVVAGSAYTMLYSVGFLSHAFSAVVALASLAAVIRAVHQQRLSALAVCFSLVVIGTVIRPYTGAVIALLCTVYTVHGFLHRSTLRLRAFAVVGVAGLLSVSLVLLVNRIYTGDFLISPYAYARGGASVRELTMDPSIIASNLLHAWRWSFADTLCTSFPFVFLAAGYACWREREFRREAVVLSLLFPMLVVAYIFQRDGSASFDGERYYYEGYAALCIAGARGFLLFISDWRIRRRNAAATLSVLLATQAVFVAFVIRDIEEILTPWRMAYRASIAYPAPKLVFLSGDTPIFTAKHANWNGANWKAEPTVFLNDPGVARRNEVACRFADSTYRIVSYNRLSGQAQSHDFVTTCPPP